MKDKNRTYLFDEKVDSFLFAILYIVVLTITTFHHHPIDLLGINNTVGETSNQESNHSYTAKQCPIINFSKTGFNSLSIEDPIKGILFSNSIEQELTSSKFNFQNFISYFTLRGPPSIMIV